MTIEGIKLEQPIKAGWTEPTARISTHLMTTIRTLPALARASRILLIQALPMTPFREIVFISLSPTFILVGFAQDVHLERSENMGLMNFILKDDVNGVGLILKGKESQLSQIVVIDGSDRLPLLHFIASAGSSKVAEWYRNKGGDVNIRDSFGRFAGEVALEGGNYSVCEVLKRQAVEFSNESIRIFFEERSQTGIKVRDVNGEEFSKDGNISINWSPTNAVGVANIGISHMENGNIQSVEAGQIISRFGYFMLMIKETAIF